MTEDGAELLDGVVRLPGCVAQLANINPSNNVGTVLLVKDFVTDLHLHQLLYQSQ